MDDNKRVSDEMIRKYISSEISIIKKKRNDPRELRTNKQFHSQITLRMEGGTCDVHEISNGEL